MSLNSAWAEFQVKRFSIAINNEPYDVRLVQHLFDDCDRRQCRKIAWIVRTIFEFRFYKQD